MAGGVIFQLQLQTAFRIHAHQQRRAYRIAAGKADRPARVLLRDGRVRQGNLFVELVFDAEVAAKHLALHIFAPIHGQGASAAWDKKSVDTTEVEAFGHYFQVNIVLKCA